MQISFEHIQVKADQFNGKELTDDLAFELYRTSHGMAFTDFILFITLVVFRRVEGVLKTKA
jgi:hypothetical protein